MCGTSSSFNSDNFLPFILTLIFLHSVAQGSHAFKDALSAEELLLNKFFFTSFPYFHPAAVITSNASACFAP